MPRDPFDYAGRRVLVTGCASGIGRAAARLLVEAGAEVAGIDWQDCDLPLSSFTRLDLRDQIAIDRFASTLAAPVEALFNCAGMAPMHPWRDVMAVNFIGLRQLTRAIAETMPPGSAIVSVGSNGGANWRDRLAELRAFVATPSFDAAFAWCEANEAPQANAYSFAKEAVVVWTMAEAAGLIARGIRINCTSPGAVQTPMLDAIAEVVPADRMDIVCQPSGRRSSPDEQAWTLLMLNSAFASYVTGVDLPVDGGFIAGRRLATG